MRVWPPPDGQGSYDFGAVAARNLIYGQVAFFCFLFLCFLVNGSAFGHNHGFSFYGSNDQTFVLYALGFAGAAFFSGRAATCAERIGGETGVRLATGIRTLIALLLLDLSTPDTIDQFFYDAHIVASVLLFLFELAFGLWLMVRVVWSVSGRLLLGCQFLAGVSAGLSQVHWLSLLGESILVYQVAFGVLLAVAATALEPAAQRLTSRSA